MTNKTAYSQTGKGFPLSRWNLAAKSRFCNRATRSRTSGDQGRHISMNGRFGPIWPRMRSLKNGCKAHAYYAGRCLLSIINFILFCFFTTQKCRTDCCTATDAGWILVSRMARSLAFVAGRPTVSTREDLARKVYTGIPPAQIHDRIQNLIIILQLEGSSQPGQAHAAVDSTQRKARTSDLG